MKRTALARKTPLRTKAPMARKPIKRKATRKQSTDKRWRSEKYLAFVRSLPCMGCGTYGCDAHHVIGLGWGLSGMGLTAPDSYAMSLCRACHTLTHQNTEMQAMQPDWLRHTLRAGIAQFTGETREQLTHALAFIEEKSE
ncbi:DUF968 domain-containing protein [Vreelandella populi]|uniref:DUF968 domain-containing protein n=1 Tax=Vreelandella populi TaxID=2498858 RepID=A0A433LG31_9GAMM|nr:DUF968 domain-containing protein [Halomonas populi]RUR48820.1 DUF968 domain-containing protein [Halomonas populi]